MWIPWKINILFTLFSFGFVVMTDWTNNLMKIGVAPLIRAIITVENSLEQAALFIKRFIKEGLLRF
jgi:hypothetical protein